MSLQKCLLMSHVSICKHTPRICKYIPRFICIEIAELFAASFGRACRQKWAYWIALTLINVEYSCHKNNCQKL